MVEHWVQFISSASIGIALFAALQLLIQDYKTAPAEKTHAYRALALFLALSALSGLELLFDQTGVYTRAPELIGIIWPFRLFYGPVLLVYVLEMTGAPQASWPMKRRLKVWGTAVAAFTLSLSFFLLPAPLRQSVYNLSDTQAPLGWLVVLGFSILFLVLTLGYLGAAFWVLARHVQTVRELFSNLENRTLSWLRGVLLVMLAAWSWGVLKTAFPLPVISSPWVDLSDALVECAWISVVGLFGLWQRPVFRQNAESPVLVEPSAKYARSALAEERQVMIAEKLERLMRAERVYRDPLLSLSTLADRMAVTPNHLSQTLNDRLGQSFFDYVNQWRVKDALARIAETTDPLLTIAYDVGFNSRSTFNLAVKKQTGQAPSAFRKT